MFASAPIRLSSSFSWCVAVEGYRLHTIRIPEWARSPEGYEKDWDEHGKVHLIGHFRHGERCIAPKVDCSFEMRRPLEDPSLFLSFANLDCTETAVLKFASRHGLLWFGPTSGDPPREDGEPPSDLPYWKGIEKLFSDLPDGESLENWYSEIRSLRLGIALWNVSRADSDRAVQELVADPQYDETWQGSSGTFILGGAELPAWPKEQQVQTREDALHAAHAIALAKFDASVWRFTRTLPKNRYVLEVAPATLPAALWMQFACAMASDARYRRCEYEGCRGFFDASVTRKSRRYCSNSCKTRAYNKRHPEGATASVPKPTVPGDR